MSCTSQQHAGSSRSRSTQVICPLCDHLMLHSTQITVQCHDGHGYHRSCCVNCLLMEMDDCCFEVTEKIISTMDDCVECKLMHKSKHAREAADFATFNFLEYALRSVIHIDDAPVNAGLSTQANSLEIHDVQTPVHDHHSTTPDSDFEDSDIVIICNDLTEEESIAYATLTNPTSPEDLPDYVDDNRLNATALSVSTGSIEHLTLDQDQAFETHHKHQQFCQAKQEEKQVTDTLNPATSTTTFFYK